MERLQKLIAQAGLCSRRAAEKIILAGRVTVDGKIVTELGTKVDAEQKICVDGKILRNAEKIYLMLNKPRGYVSTTQDERGRRTVIDLLGENFPARVFPIGRLDFDSEGLILLTNDGELTNALIHPRYEVEKIYRAKISGDITDDKLDRLRDGVQLDDGMTAPAKIFLRGENIVDIAIHEGRNRQVRRMFAAVGCAVKKLRRINFAGLSLGDLPLGKFRELTADEVAHMKEFMS